ncbi:MAG: shikimate kinase [Bacteroidales bacterium]|nr:shikimate kinase [Bacteroidales bacterium]
MRIYLIGYMASGKSNLGHALAGRLGYDFVDLDTLIEQRYRITILDFFEKYGEETFRKLEKIMLQDTLSLQNTVIATGGGTACFFDNMDFINSAGTSIYLRWEILALMERLKQVRRKRPLLKDIPPEHLENTVAEQLSIRSFFYNQANLIVEAGKMNATEAINWILERLETD